MHPCGWTWDRSIYTVPSNEWGGHVHLKPSNGANGQCLGVKVSILSFFKKYLFIYLAALGLSCGMQALSCGMWDLVP